MWNPAAFNNKLFLFFFLFFVFVFLPSVLTKWCRNDIFSATRGTVDKQ